MRFQKGDVLIGFKAISLTPGIRNSDREVATALLDHFNRQTGQCDPSIARLAGLLGVSKRTIFRSLSRIEADRLFFRVRHGGHLNRNSYEPNWQRFREIEAIWRARMKRQGIVGPALSPERRQGCQLKPATPVTQTCRTNLSKETYQIGSPEKSIYAGDRTPSSSPQVETGSRNRSSHTSDRPPVRPTSARDAMREAAHRRWENELLQRFRMHPALNGRIVELIDTEMAEAATDAELQRRHSGIEHIVRAVVARDPVLASALDAILGGQR